MKFKVKHKESAFFIFMCGVVRIFKKKPRIIRLYEGEMKYPCILIGNHSAVSGPMTCRMSLSPPPIMSWSAHQMCENYKARSEYMRKIYYRKKLGYGKFRSNVLGTLFPMVLGIFYKAAGMIPVYYDNRAKLTFDYSLQALGEGVPVLIFPEDSDSGYFEILEKKMHPGYISLARLYKRRFGEDVPVYPMHYSKAENAIVVGEPQYVSKLAESMDKDEMNEYFRKYINSLCEYLPQRENP